MPRAMREHRAQVDLEDRRDVRRRVQQALDHALGDALAHRRMRHASTLTAAACVAAGSRARWRRRRCSRATCSSTSSTVMRPPAPRAANRRPRRARAPTAGVAPPGCCDRRTVQSACARQRRGRLHRRSQARAQLRCAGAAPLAAALRIRRPPECGRAARPARSRPAPASGFPRSTPPAGAGISIVTLSVSSSISGSFSATASPTDFSQRCTCERVPSRLFARRADFDGGRHARYLLFRCSRWCGSPARCARRSARPHRAAADCAGSARPAS